MAESFLLWRCLHHGPLSRDTIDRWPSGGEVPWERCRKRNLPLLAKLTRAYGACAIVARDGERIVGHLRFYPKAVCGMAGAGCLCLQQDYPAGPAEDFAEEAFPPPAQIEDRDPRRPLPDDGLLPAQGEPVSAKGSSARRMVKALIEWAKANGWRRIEADSFEDLPIIYGITGSAGHTFWEKLGFRLVDRHPHPYLQDRSEFVDHARRTGEIRGHPAREGQGPARHASGSDIIQGCDQAWHGTLRRASVPARLS